MSEINEEMECLYHSKRSLRLTEEIIHILKCQFCNKPVSDPVLIPSCKHIICKSCLSRNKSLCFCSNRGKHVPFSLAEDMLKELLTLKELLCKSTKIESESLNCSPKKDISLKIEDNDKYCKNIISNNTTYSNIDENSSIYQYKSPSSNEKKRKRINKRTTNKLRRKSNQEESLDNKINMRENDTTMNDIRNDQGENISSSNFCTNDSDDSENGKKLYIPSISSADLVLNSKIFERTFSTPSTSKSLRHSKRNRPKETKINPHKINKQGESPLHLAAINNNVENLKMLIALGGDINLKDYGGWTPLHECVINNAFDCANVLLESGALVNVPGGNNNTALHDAVFGNKFDFVKLLLSFGANKESRNLDGHPPIYFSKTQEMNDLLNQQVDSYSSTSLSNLNVSFHSNPKTQNYLIFAVNLNNDQKDKLKLFSDTFHCPISKQYRKEVTHLVTDSKIIVSSGLYLIALHSYKSIVSIEWIEQSLKVNRLIEDISDFEVEGSNLFPKSYGPRKARISAEQKEPGLLNGCNIFLLRGINEFSNKPFYTMRPQFETLLQASGANLLKREPQSAFITEKTFPYHASKNGHLSECSHYIIYQQGRNEPKCKYKMKDLKSLPFSWLLECLETFQLEYEPAKYE